MPAAIKAISRQYQWIVARFLRCLSRGGEGLTYARVCIGGGWEGIIGDPRCDLYDSIGSWPLCIHFHT